MLSINDMVPGNKYLVGDSCGYDILFEAYGFGSGLYIEPR